MQDVRRPRCPGAALLAALAACSGGAVDCSAAGCTNGVTVLSPPGVDDVSSGTLVVCIGDQCVDDRTFSFGGPDAVASFELVGAEVGVDASAVLVMPDGSRFEASAPLRRVRPNGEGCAPECAFAELHLRA